MEKLLLEMGKDIHRFRVSSEIQPSTTVWWYAGEGATEADPGGLLLPLPPAPRLYSVSQGPGCCRQRAHGPHTSVSNKLWPVETQQVKAGQKGGETRCCSCRLCLGSISQDTESPPAVGQFLLHKSLWFQIPSCEVSVFSCLFVQI